MYYPQAPADLGVDLFLRGTDGLFRRCFRLRTSLSQRSLQRSGLRARGLHLLCGVRLVRGPVSDSTIALGPSYGSAPVTHLDQEQGRVPREAPAGSLALRVPQKTVGSWPCPSVVWDRLLDSRCRVQPLMAHDEGASAASLKRGRRLPLRPAGSRPDPMPGSAASAQTYPNARCI